MRTNLTVLAGRKTDKQQNIETANEAAVLTAQIVAAYNTELIKQKVKWPLRRDLVRAFQETMLTMGDA